MGSTGHSPSLSNEGNTTLPHTSTSAQPSPIPGPIAHVNHTISNRWCQVIYSTLDSEITLQLMHCIMFVYYPTTDFSLDATKLY